MNPGRFYVPRVGMGIRPVFGSNYLPSRGIGFFSNIRNSIRGINFSGILSGANKTLNVVNQTIPLIRQARPMFNNMRSMFQLAKAFGSETNTSKKVNTNNIRNNFNINEDKNTNSKLDNTNLIQKKETQNNNYPSFFI